MRFQTFLLVLCVASQAGATDVAFHNQSTIRFATKEQAAKLLGQSDRFSQTQSLFDRQSRLKTDRDVAEADFLKFSASHAREWKPEEIEKLTSVIASLKKRLDEQQLKVPFPKTVVLIKTSGEEEGAAAYCRQNAVILPQQKVKGQERGLERLMTHELFHILSANNEEARRKLYPIIGFKPCKPISLPKSLAHRKITNPDGPIADSYITLKVDDKEVNAVPILYASVEKYDASEGGSFFKYLKFELMSIKKDAEAWQPLMTDGKPVLLNPRSVNSYFEQIGNNTGYIIHPDEVLADNFVFMVFKRDNLKTPRIPTKMKKVLSK